MVVFFDIDGTIIDNDTQRIPQSTMDAVTALRKNGHIPVLNTGRVSGHIDPRVEAMDFMGKVCGCGMEVILDRPAAGNASGGSLCRLPPDGKGMQYAGAVRTAGADDHRR